MMEIADLNPDVALAKLLDNNVTVQTSATESHIIRAYDDEEKPNKNLGDEFIEVDWNGGARSRTLPLGQFDGSLMLSVYVKTQDDGRAKKKLVRQIISQCESIIRTQRADGFFFNFDPYNVITPTTANLTTGYSVTILNVKWRIREDFLVGDKGSLRIGSSKFGTFFTYRAFLMPRGVTGGIVTEAALDGKLAVDWCYTEGVVVPAGTAMLTKGEPNTYTFDYVSSLKQSIKGNYIHGADAVDADGKTFVDGEDVKYYILSYDKNGENFGFYWGAENGAPITYGYPYAFLAVDRGKAPPSLAG